MTGYPARHRGRRLRGVLAATVGAVSVLVSLAGVDAYGGYVARVTNNDDSAATNTYFTCLNAAVGEAGTRALFAYPFGESSGTVAADESGRGAPGTYGSAGVSLGQPANGAVCPRDNRTVVTLNGSTGYILGPAATSPAPAVFSEEIWFNPTARQGKLIGFGSARTAGASLTYDRHLYLTTTGRLVFGVGVANTVSSPTPVALNTWHHAVATLSSGGMKLYLDGTLVDQNQAVTSGLAYLTGGYWRIGYDSLVGWPGAGSEYFAGQLAFAAAYDYPLSAAQVSAHYIAGR